MTYLAPPPSPAPVVVYKDVGGLVSDYEARTEQYRRENREVRLHECRSACTLALSLPNVCVFPDAKVKFHQAYNAITREVDQGVSARLFASYPAAVQGRLGYLTREYRVLSGSELIALGMRNCNGPGQTDTRVLVASRAKPAPAAPLAGSNPLGDIAHNVSAAVASAWSKPETATSEPIRVAVADRRDVPPTLARISGDGGARQGLRSDLPSLSAPREGFAALALPAEIPLPPRRPPSLAFSAQDKPAVDAQDQRPETTNEKGANETLPEISQDKFPEPLPPPRRESLIDGAQPVLAAAHFIGRDSQGAP